MGHSKMPHLPTTPIGRALEGTHWRRRNERGVEQWFCQIGDCKFYGRAYKRIGDLNAHLIPLHFKRAHKAAGRPTDGPMMAIPPPNTRSVARSKRPAELPNPPMVDRITRPREQKRRQREDASFLRTRKAHRNCAASQQIPCAKDPMFGIGAQLKELARGLEKAISLFEMLNAGERTQEPGRPSSRAGCDFQTPEEGDALGSTGQKAQSSTLSPTLDRTEEPHTGRFPRRIYHGGSSVGVRYRKDDMVLPIPIEPIVADGGQGNTSEPVSPQMLRSRPILGGGGGPKEPIHGGPQTPGPWSEDMSSPTRYSLVDPNFVILSAYFSVKEVEVIESDTEPTYKTYDIDRPSPIRIPRGSSFRRPIFIRESPMKAGTGAACNDTDSIAMDNAAAQKQPLRAINLKWESNGRKCQMLLPALYTKPLESPSAQSGMSPPSAATLMKDLAEASPGGSALRSVFTERILPKLASIALSELLMEVDKLAPIKHGTLAITTKETRPLLDVGMPSHPPSLANSPSLEDCTKNQVTLPSPLDPLSQVCLISTQSMEWALDVMEEDNGVGPENPLVEYASDTGSDPSL